MSNKTLIILVNYKRPLDTVECIKSLLRQSNLNWDCVVYENGSSDSSYLSIVESVSQLDIGMEIKKFNGFNSTRVFTEIVINNEHKNKLLIIEGKENLGFAGGNNEAVKFTLTRYCNNQENDYGYYWFLNNDTIVAENCLAEFINYYSDAKNSKVGICGATVLYQDQPDTIQCMGGAKYSKVWGLVTEIGNREKLTADILNSSVSLDYVSGACMFTTSKFLNAVGLMESSYFLYFEELDWATRASKHGFSLGYAKNALVWHKEGSILGSGKSSKRGTLAEFYGLRSRLRFTGKFYPHYLPTIWIVGALQLISKLIKGQSKNAYALFNALIFKNSP